MINNIDKLKNILRNNSIIDIFFSGNPTGEFLKIEIRKTTTGYQAIRHKNNQVFHLNLLDSEVEKYFFDNINSFKQVVIYTAENDFQIFIKGSELKVITNKPTKIGKEISNNKIKNYILNEGENIDFLRVLKIMDEEFKIYPSKQKKFRQINRFLEFIDDVADSFQNHIRIIDFGSGKSYLTFALYYYFNNIRNLTVEIIGIDLKEDVIADCNRLKDELQYQNLRFICGDIKDYQEFQEVDLVVSLHACDIATDYALEKAVRWNAKAILLVPCCQHEINLNSKLSNYGLLNKYGLIKERTSALITDTIRASVLTCLGYKTQILEFIDMEHTAKNLLIRAQKSNNKNMIKEKEELFKLVHSLEYQPKIIDLIKDLL